MGRRLGLLEVVPPRRRDDAAEAARVVGAFWNHAPVDVAVGRKRLAELPQRRRHRLGLDLERAAEGPVVVRLRCVDGVDTKAVSH